MNLLIPNDFSKQNEPSQCLTHRNGSNRRHIITMHAASLQLADIAEKDKERFWSMVEILRENECWPWKAGKFIGGYGGFTLRGKTLKAHRVSFALTHGAIASELLICHKCDNPPCCNPHHLFMGTTLDNQTDKWKKNRGSNGIKNGHYTKPERTPRGDNHPSRLRPETRPRGEDHYMAKVNSSQVLEIRKLSNSGVSYSALANRFRISEGTVFAIVKNKTWKHVK